MAGYFTTCFGKKVKRDENGQFYFSSADLAEVRLVPYRGKLHMVDGFGGMRVYLSDSYLKIRLRGQNEASHIYCVYNQKEHCLYMAESKFNAHWQEIRSRLISFYRYQRQDETVTPAMLDERVDLSLYRSQTIDAKIEKGRIVTFPKEPDEATKLLISKRASAMDNRKLCYVFDANDSLVHDKSCRLVKDISNEAFRAAETIPEGRVLCKACRRRVYVRQACGDDFKNYEIYNRFLTKGAMSQTALERFVGDYAGRMFMEAANLMRVRCGQDTWKIEIQEKGQIVLYHNNYVMINDEERYITDGFHLQNITAIKLDYLFNYIEKYTWQGHLEAKRLAQLEMETMDVAKEAVSQPPVAESEISQNQTRERWWKRLIKWFGL